MKKYRITKYNPSFRNEKGHYLLDDWTSFNDIGKNFYDGILTEETYFEIECKYIQSIEILLDDNDIRSMCVTQLEKNKCKDLYKLLSKDEKSLLKNIKVGSFISKENIGIVCKMILRELMWAEFESLDESLIIKFGYDFYMYALCSEISEATKTRILKKGLYVEEL